MHCLLQTVTCAEEITKIGDCVPYTVLLLSCSITWQVESVVYSALLKLRSYGAYKYIYYYYCYYYSTLFRNGRLSVPSEVHNAIVQSSCPVNMTSVYESLNFSVANDFNCRHSFFCAVNNTNYQLLVNRHLIDLVKHIMMMVTVNMPTYSLGCCH